MAKNNVANDKSAHFPVLSNEETVAQAAALLASCAFPAHDTLPIEENKLNALHLAVNEENIEETEILLENGADARLKNSHKQNCLHVAAAKGNVELVKLLVKHVDVNAVAQCNNTALHIAVVCGTWYPSNKWTSKWNNSYTTIDQNMYMNVVSELLENGADPNLRDQNGETPLHLVAKNMCKIDNVKVANLLVSHGALINFLDKLYFTPLYTAMRWRNIQIAKYLVTVAANSESKDAHFKKFLMEAFLSNCEEIVDYLMDNGADINRVYEDGINLLNVILKSKQIRSLEVVKFMMQKGANLASYHRNGVDDEKWEKVTILYREIIQMKLTKVCKTSAVTYFDVLSKRNYALIRCLRDDGVTATLRSRNHESRFKHFSARLLYNFLRGCERIRKLNRFHQILSNFFGDKLTKKMIAKICLYFSDKELERYLD